MTINAERNLKKHHRIIPTIPGGQSGPDRYVLCRWNLIYGCMVEASNNDLAELLMEVPDFLSENEDERLCVCEVMSWREDQADWSMDPHEIETLYEIHHYADPTEEDEESESILRGRIDDLTLQLNRERDHYEGLMRGDIPAGFDVTEETRDDLTKMQRAALKKMGETAKKLAEEVDKL